MKFEVNVHDVRASFETSSREFFYFVRTNFEHFISTNDRNELEIQFEYYPFYKWGQERIDFPFEEADRLGTGCYALGNSLFWEGQRGFKVAVTYDEKIKIKASFQEQLVQALYRTFIQRRSNKYEIYLGVMRQIIHFPIFSILEQKRNMAIIHATTVEKEGKVIIFAGLGGSGKTTLGMYLHLKHGFNILSDNFLLVDGEKIYPFPERVGLSKESVNILGLPLDANAPLTGGKYLYSIGSIAPTPVMAQAKYFFITCLTNKETSLEKIPKERALAILLSMHDFLKEFHYQSYLALKDLIQVKSPPLDRKNLIERSLKDTDCYILKRNQTKPMEKIFEEVIACT